MKRLSYIEDARCLKVNSDISLLIICNKTGGTIKGDINKNYVKDNTSVTMSGIVSMGKTSTF